ncbi:MAG TPA: cyclic nucleotide-binding domain-containing protein [Acidimicrobiales bacterium]|nr:cyclic nucleotide-binding domain-containing protein [Acidimicrobiales bacterium]
MAKSDPTLDKLAQVELFHGMSSHELEAIHEHAKEMTFRAGDVIGAEGERGGRFHLILDGEVDVDVHGEARPPLGPGASFGEMSLVDDAPRSATLRAKTDVRTLSISGFNFRPMLVEHPQIALKLLQQLSARLRRVEAASAQH